MVEAEVKSTMFIRGRQCRSIDVIEAVLTLTSKNKDRLPRLGTRSRQGLPSMIFDNSSSPGFVIISVHSAEELDRVTPLLYSVWDLAAALLARAGFLVGTRGRDNGGFCKEGRRMSLGVTKRFFPGQWSTYRTSSLAIVLA